MMESELIKDAMSDARCNVSSTRIEMSRLLDELRAAERIVDDIEMARTSVEVLKKIDSAISDLIAEFKCVKYLRYQSDYIERQENS
jgi:hypothetical protein